MSAYAMEKYWRRSHMSEEQRKDYLEEIEAAEEEMMSAQEAEADAIGEMMR